MGYGYGTLRYGSHRYSYLADWWTERQCENDRWTERVCATPVWASDPKSLVNPWLKVEVQQSGHSAPLEARQSGFKPARPP
jgi:hypothetical protein